MSSIDLGILLIQVSLTANLLLPSWKLSAAVVDQTTLKMRQMGLTV
jgi:hypothetical protein